LFLWLRSVERDYAFPPLLEAVNLYVTNSEKALASVQTIRVIILISYLVFSIGLYVTYFNPLVWLLNEETRRICAMLLMLPTSVLENLSRVKEFVAKLSKSLTISDDHS
jgi:hypothetical protein